MSIATGFIAVLCFVQLHQIHGWWPSTNTVGMHHSGRQQIASSNRGSSLSRSFIIGGRCSTSSSRLHLDACDVLEDELELLFHVRQQMDQDFQATPREITNRIKEFFSSSKISASIYFSDQQSSARINSNDENHVAAFKQYLITNKSSMDVVNVILLIEGCVRTIQPFLSFLPWSTLLDAMRKPSGALTSSMVYRGISCLRGVDMRDPDSHLFQKLLLERIEESHVLLNEKDLCPAIYSLQTLNCQNIYTRQIFRYLSRCMAAIEEPIAAKPLCSAIYAMRKHKPTNEVRYLLWELANHIDRSPTCYHSVNVCIALNGLQGMDDCYPEVRRILAALLQRAIGASEQGIDKAGDREISMALFGLQRMGSDPSKKSHPRSIMGAEETVSTSVHHLLESGGSSAGIAADTSNLVKYSGYSPLQRGNKRVTTELQATLAYVSSLLEHLEGPFEAKRLGFAMMGLSRLHVELPETRSIVQQLTLKATDAWGDVNGQELSMILRGLINLQSDSADVRALVSKIVPLVKKCPFMTNADVRSALLGLQGMHADSSKEVAALFSAVTDLLERSKIKFSTPSDISSALYGLQGLGSETPSGKKLLLLLTKMMDSVPLSFPPVTTKNDPVEPILVDSIDVELGYSPASDRYSRSTAFKGRDVAMSLYGLRAASGAAKEAIDIISALVPHVVFLEDRLTANDVATCLYGLQNFNSKQKKVLELLRALNPHILNASGKFNPKGLSMALNGLQGFDSSHVEVRELIRGISIIARRTVGDFPGFEDFHQLSAALYGLSSLSTTHPEVVELVTCLSKMVHTQQPSSSRRTKSPGLQKLESTPKADKVGMAMYGLQRMSPKVEAMNTLLEGLLEYVTCMPSPNCIAIGMAFQSFKFCNGQPTAVQSAILDVLADKIVGFSSRNIGKTKSSMYNVRKPQSADKFATIRSVLNGIAGLDCRHGSIQKVLRSIASEMLSADFELPNCDAQTARLLKRTYEQLLLRCPDLSADAGIASFMTAVNKTLYRKTLLAAPLVASPVS